MTEWTLSDAKKRHIDAFMYSDISIGTLLHLLRQEDKEFIKRLKEEFDKNWSYEFKESVLKDLTAHDEMCFTEKDCKCQKIMNDFIDKLAGDGLI